MLPPKVVQVKHRWKMKRSSLFSCFWCTSMQLLGCCFTNYAQRPGYTGLNLKMIHTWRSHRGENFQSCQEGGGINSTVASLHSFIKCLTILPIPALINLLHLSSLPPHTLSQLSQHPHTPFMSPPQDRVCVCVGVYPALIFCSQSAYTNAPFTKNGDFFKIRVQLTIFFSITKYLCSETKQCMPSYSEICADTYT